jgi:glycosyltransferase involved in cell wall biosynthesis
VSAAASEGGGEGAPRVLLLPCWRENPYQELLAERLAARGAAVDHGRRKALWKPFRILRRGVDVVHLHSAATFIRSPNALGAAGRGLRTLASLIILRIAGVRLIWTAHDLRDHEGRFPALDYCFTWALARLASAVVTHGERATSLVAQRYRMRRRSRFAVIPHAPFTRYVRADVERAAARRRLGIGREDLVYLFLGSIRPYKGVPDLVEAFRRLDAEGTRLVIRGSVRRPELEERLKAACAGDDRIDFAAGFVPDPEVAVYLEACDMVVAPYRAVLTSGSVLLAMSLGRACIAPNLGCIPDTLDESCGFLYDPEDPEGLIEALRRALTQRERLVEMGRAARERAARVSWDEVAERTLALYRR